MRTVSALEEKLLLWLFRAGKYYLKVKLFVASQAEQKIEETLASRQTTFVSKRYSHRVGQISYPIEKKVLESTYRKQLLFR